MKNFSEEFKEATLRGQEMLRTAPLAKSVSYDRKNKRLIVELQNGVTFLVPTNLIQIFEGATDSQIADVKLLIEGLYLRWESLDEDLSVVNLMNGIFGTSKWMKNLNENLLNVKGKNRRLEKMSGKKAI